VGQRPCRAAAWQVSNLVPCRSEALPAGGQAAAHLFFQCIVAWRSLPQHSHSGYQSFSSPLCFTLSKHVSSISARSLIPRAHAVCICVPVAILDLLPVLIFCSRNFPSQFCLLLILMEERFILASSFGGFSTWSVGPVALDLYRWFSMDFLSC
jgi:hypothetical protein